MAKTKEGIGPEIEKEPYDPWKDMVTIKIPKDRNTKEDVSVSINGRRFLIQRGVSVDVPRPVADLLEDVDRAQEARDAYIEENASE